MNAHDVYKFCCDEFTKHQRPASKDSIAAHFDTTVPFVIQKLQTLWQSGLLVPDTCVPAYEAHRIGFAGAMTRPKAAAYPSLVKRPPGRRGLR